MLKKDSSYKIRYTFLCLAWVSEEIFICRNKNLHPRNKNLILGNKNWDVLVVKVCG